MQLEVFLFQQELGLLVLLLECFVLIQLPSYGLRLEVILATLSLLLFISPVENWSAIQS
jgi:hypothetical protein